MRNISIYIFSIFITASLSCSDFGSKAPHDNPYDPNGSNYNNPALTYNIIYDANGAQSGDVPVDPNDYEAGQDVVILGNTGVLIKAGYAYSGWNTEIDGSGTTYTQGQSLTMGADDVTLYARWTDNPTYKVTYDGNGKDGGSVPVDTTNYEEGQPVTVLGNTEGLVKTGYTFNGWNTEDDGSGDDYDATGLDSFTMGTVDVTLYAKWTLIVDLPSVTTTDIAGNLTFTPFIAGISAKGGGNVTSEGSATVTDRGLCWNTTGTPTIGDSKVSEGPEVGIFNNSTLSGLTVDTIYYVRAYATNSQGTAYGNEISFNSGYEFSTDHAGGYVFYNDGSSGGLVSAKTDQSAEAEWGCFGMEITGADGTAVGTGEQNTIDVVNGCSTSGIAARICSDLSLGGYDDWFLPSKDELNLIYYKLHLNGAGGFAVNIDYWSSSEYHANTSWEQYFGFFSQDPRHKGELRRVRAVRAFSSHMAGDKLTFTADGVNFIMAYVPAKSFKTGIDDSGTASITNAYWIGETEVTYELWSAVYTWATSNGYYFANVGRQGSDFGSGPVGTNQHPVGAINWRDSLIWCNAATEWYNAMNGTSYTCAYYIDSGYITPIKDSRDGAYGASVDPTAGSFDNPYVKTDATGFRLLTSNEWELAARYKTDSNNDGDITDVGEYYPGTYASGATADYNNATATGAASWYNGNSGNSSHEVKGRAANALGLYDICGNAYEWCFDWHMSHVGSQRVARGGYWGDNATSMQLFYVAQSPPYFEGNDFGDGIGFRFARTQ